MAYEERHLPGAPCRSLSNRDATSLLPARSIVFSPGPRARSCRAWRVHPVKDVSRVIHRALHRVNPGHAMLLAVSIASCSAHPYEPVSTGASGYL